MYREIDEVWNTIYLSKNSIKDKFILMVSNLTNLDFRYELRKSKIALVTNINFIKELKYTTSIIKIPENNFNNNDSKILDLISKYDEQLEYVEEVLEFLNSLKNIEIAYVYYKYINYSSREELIMLLSLKKSRLQIIECDIFEKFYIYFCKK